jgi:hypothetical protein
MNSMPYYICEKSYDYCIADNPNDQAAQDNCTTNIRDQCGTLDIANFTAVATTSSAPGGPTSAPTSASTASGTSSSTSTSASATKNAAAAAMVVGNEYGSSIIAALFVAAFGFMV